MLTLEPRRKKLKLHIPTSVVRTLISVIVLLVLMVGAGVGYVWYSGRHPSKDVQADQTSIARPVKPTYKPVQPGPNAPVGLSVQSLTTPVAPGDNSMISVRTLPDAVCTISVVYDKTASKDSGLAQKIADEYGLVSWSWTVEANVPLGKWPVNVTCARGNKSGFVQGYLEVAKPAAN